MGMSDSPGIQAKMMVIFKRMLNDRLSAVCAEQAVSHAKTAEVAWIFVDDGMIRHDKLCTPA